MSATGHITWVGPARMERSWLPEYFAPLFCQVDDELAKKASAYQRLGEIVRRVNTQAQPGLKPEWIVRRSANSIRVDRASSLEGEDIESTGWIPLPEECVVLHTMVFRGGTVAAFWSSKVARGVAATTRNHHVLAPATQEDIAWLEISMSDPIVMAQLERAALGKFLAHVTAEDLLEVHVPRPVAEERYNTSVVRDNLAKRTGSLRLAQDARNRLVHSLELLDGLPLLTAATFEERVEQFEHFLLEEQIAGPGTGFFCQAARRDPRSDLFVVRRIGVAPIARGVVPGRALQFDDDEGVNAGWRSWYWNAQGGTSYVVLNAIGEQLELPGHLLARTIGDPRHLKIPASGGIRIPAFSEFRWAVEASYQGDPDVDPMDRLQGDRGDSWGQSELGQLWARLNPGVPPTPDVVEWLRTLFRPVLAVRLMRDQQVAGAYLIFGEDQITNPTGVLAHLEILGERLVAVLRQPSRIAEQAARSESLRRLSWMMHQLGGPLTRIGNVVEELVDYAATHPETAAILLPDEPRARARAELNELPIGEYTMGSRLTKLEAAVEEIRHLRYLIRRFKNAQGVLQVSVFSLHELLDELATNAREQLTELQTRVECERDLVVEADRGLVRTALAEVVGNACRECRLRDVDTPSLVLSGMRRDDRARITIEDNAFPTDAKLLPDVFAEDASTYRSQGRGSGLGLAIVKETFWRHGSRCDLIMNSSVDGSRRPGVTFVADLAVNRSMEENDRV